MKIGIIGRRLTDKRNFQIFNEEIIDVIRNYECIPICIPVNKDNEAKLELKELLPLINMCSGFIFPGGSEITDIDKEIMKYAYNNDIPTLGICLGCQIMGATFEGTLTTNENFHQSQDEYVHEVTIDKNSKLYEIIKKETIKVNSRHSYCLNNTKLNKVASSDVIEAIEDKNKPFFIGIQWHPETIIDENTNNLFNYFFKIIKK